MMTSPNGNIFRDTVPLCGEITGHRWIHAQGPVTRSLNKRLNKRLSKQSIRLWFEGPSLHYDVTGMHRGLSTMRTHVPKPKLIYWNLPVFSLKIMFLTWASPCPGQIIKFNSSRMDFIVFISSLISRFETRCFWKLSTWIGYSSHVGYGWYKDHTVSHHY